MNPTEVVNQIITTGKMTYEGLSRLAECAVNACEAYADLQELCNNPASLTDPALLARGVAAKRALSKAIDALLMETVNAVGTIQFTGNTLKNIVEGFCNEVSQKVDDNGGTGKSTSVSGPNARGV